MLHENYSDYTPIILYSLHQYHHCLRYPHLALNISILNFRFMISQNTDNIT